MFLSSCIFYLLKELSWLQQESSLWTADVFPVAASLRPGNTSAVRRPTGKGLEAQKYKWRLKNVGQCGWSVQLNTGQPRASQNTP